MIKTKIWISSFRLPISILYFLFNCVLNCSNTDVIIHDINDTLITNELSTYTKEQFLFKINNNISEENLKDEIIKNVDMNSGDEFNKNIFNNIEIDMIENSSKIFLNLLNSNFFGNRNKKKGTVQLGNENVILGNEIQFTNESLILKSNESIHNIFEDVFESSSYIYPFNKNNSNFEINLITENNNDQIILESNANNDVIDNTYVPQPNENNITISHHGILIKIFKSKFPVQLWCSMGVFTEDYLWAINPHWLEFDPPLPSSHYVLAALYCLVMTVGVCGNSLVIYMFFRCRSLRVPANTLVINLAVSDFIMLIKMPIFIFNSLYFGPVLGEPGCQIYGFLGGLTGTVSIMTLAAIALDRYYAIVYPLDPLRKTTSIRARLSVLFVWFYGCIFASLPLTGLGLNQYVPEGYLTSCSFDYLTSDIKSRIFIFVFFVAAWVIPFSIITVCYSGIFWEVIKTSSVTSRRGQETEKRRVEIRLACMVIGVIGLWFVAWTPYAIVALLGIFGFHHLISPLGSMIPALFCKSASCIDPYVYVMTHPRFRREITKLFLPRRNTMLRYQSRFKDQTNTDVSRMGSVYMRRQDSTRAVELKELKIVQPDVHPRLQKSFWLSKFPIPGKKKSNNTHTKSLTDSKKSLSGDNSNPNSCPF